MAYEITEYSIVDMTPDQRCRKHIKLTQGVIMESCFDRDDNVGGDVLLIRDWLQEAGFEFGKHFYLKKHIIERDPKEEDFYAGGELKGDIAREEDN